MQRMARGEVNVYDELFSYSCPKFITAVPPAYDNPSVNTSQQVCAASYHMKHTFPRTLFYAQCK